VNEVLAETPDAQTVQEEQQEQQEE
jgi:hypothetical protein